MYQVHEFSGVNGTYYRVCHNGILEAPKFYFLATAIDYIESSATALIGTVIA